MILGKHSAFSLFDINSKMDFSVTGLYGKNRGKESRRYEIVAIPFYLSLIHIYDLMASTGEEFLDINPMSTIEDLHKYWGHPANIFEDFQETIGAREIWKSYRRSLWLTAVICIMGALIFILIAYWIIIHYAGTIEIIYSDC